MNPPAGKELAPEWRSPSISRPRTSRKLGLREAAALLLRPSGYCGTSVHDIAKRARFDLLFDVIVTARKPCGSELI
jgi:hypothetical protein